MRIAYVNHGRFPTEKAYGSQIAQVCDALTTLGHEVTLMRPRVNNSITDTAEAYYGLHHPLHVETLSAENSFSRYVPGYLRFVYSMWPYGKKIAALADVQRQELLYIRSPFLLRAALSTGIPVIIELHAIPRFLRIFVPLFNRCVKVVCLTSMMFQELVDAGMDPHKIIIAADAVDLRRFENLPDPASAKAQWNLPGNRPIVGYVGSLATRETLEKGVRELIGASEKLILRQVQEKSEKSVPFLWIVGGPQQWVKAYQDHASSIGLSSDDIRFEGHIDAARVASAITACDVCVYPAPKSDNPYFLRDTSPLKLFEYLAAGRPVVCADLPPVRDIVSEHSVVFFQPGDSAGLAAAITGVLDHPSEAATRAEDGRRIANEHSWEKRMERILTGLPSAAKK